MAYSKAKLKSNGDKAYPFFLNTLIRKHVRQIIAYPDSAKDFIKKHFY